MSEEGEVTPRRVVNLNSGFGMSLATAVSVAAALLFSWWQIEGQIKDEVNQVRVEISAWRGEHTARIHDGAAHRTDVSELKAQLVRIEAKLDEFILRQRDQ